MPFQRFYIVNAPQLIQTIQAKANSSIFVPTLLDFGMLFSGLNWESQDVLRGAFARKGNVFATSVHEYLGGLSTLQAATRAAIHKLSTSVPDTLSGSDPVGLFETIRHSLTLALTGAVYGPENPYEKAGIESSWQSVPLLAPASSSALLTGSVESSFPGSTTYYIAPFHGSPLAKPFAPEPVSSPHSLGTLKMGVIAKPSP